MSRTIQSVIDEAIDATIRMPLKHWNWSEGIALYGLVTLANKTYSEIIMPFVQDWIDRQLQRGYVQENVNATAPCFSLLALQDMQENPVYEALIRGRVDFLLHRAKRLECGAFEHTLVETKFGGQLWIDTLVMAGLFLAKAGCQLGDEEAISEGKRQFRLHAERLQADNGLYYHGWSELNQRVIGCQWARGNAWAAIAAVELMELFPDDALFQAYAGSCLQRQLEGLQAVQDLSGLWTTVLTSPQTYLETSAAAGIAYATAKAIRLHHVGQEWKPLAERAFRAVLGYTDWDGVLRGVSSGTAVQTHPGEYHVIARDRMEGYGQGLLLLMLSESASAGMEEPTS